MRGMEGFSGDARKDFLLGLTETCDDLRTHIVRLLLEYGRSLFRISVEYEQELCQGRLPADDGGGRPGGWAGVSAYL